MTQDQIDQVRAVLGVPWVARGRDSATGWDCWGLCLVMARRLFGRSYDGLSGFYTPDLARRSDLVGDLMAASLPGFVGVEPRAGAVALFKILGIPCHVGLCLGDGQFLHVFNGCATVQADLTARPWSARLVDAYLPRGVS